jgi:hypothetical protein
MPVGNRVFSERPKATLKIATGPRGFALVISKFPDHTPLGANTPVAFGFKKTENRNPLRDSNEPAPRTASAIRWFDTGRGPSGGSITLRTGGYCK